MEPTCGTYRSHIYDYTRSVFSQMAVSMDQQLRYCSLGSGGNAVTSFFHSPSTVTVPFVIGKISL